MSSEEGNNGDGSIEVCSTSAFGFGEGVNTNPITRLKQIAHSLTELEAAKTDWKVIEKDLNAKVRALETELNQLMEDNELTSLPTEYGVLRRKERNWAKFPEDDTNRLLAIDYLKRSGLFEDLAYIQAQKMNSWLWEEVEVARKNGRPDPEILKYLEVTEGHTAGLYSK